MQNLPDNLYSVDSIVQIEQRAINQLNIPAYELMTRAGQAVFEVIKKRFPQQKNILVLCGAGNNAGDGYVIARLAELSGFNVTLISLIDPLSLVGAASQAYQDWLQPGDNEVLDSSSLTEELIADAEIIIDALLGTGLSRDVQPEWQTYINWVNNSRAQVIAVDVPSGLYADTGAIAGKAIKADITVCFIGLKLGLFTAQAADVCGEILLDKLALPDEVFNDAGISAEAKLISSINYSLLPARLASSHKGNYGHVLIVGGDKGMPGAIILAARAALRTGAGLVTIVTVEGNLESICSAVPEAMIKTCSADTVAEVLDSVFTQSISHIAIGMGLGQSDWSLAVLRFCLAQNKPVLFDADALNLLAEHNLKITVPFVLTPHPGEAARLLSVREKINTAEIQNNRFKVIKKIYDLYKANDESVVILKGSGTLIFDGSTLKVCALGNAAMAAPGMGDVLSGIIIALMAQGLTAGNAAELAVCLHASAAKSVTGDKTRGLLASDVVKALSEFVR